MCWPEKKCKEEFDVLKNSTGNIAQFTTYLFAACRQRTNRTCDSFNFAAFFNTFVFHF